MCTWGHSRCSIWVEVWDSVTLLFNDAKVIIVQVVCSNNTVIIILSYIDGSIMPFFSQTYALMMFKKTSLLLSPI